MTQKLACIVEGHSERIGLKYLVNKTLQVLQPEANPWVCRTPVQLHRDDFSKSTAQGMVYGSSDLERNITIQHYAVRELNGGVLCLCDADKEDPTELETQLRNRFILHQATLKLEFVVVGRELEAWFLACASALAQHQQLPAGTQDVPEHQAPTDCKGWLDARRPGGYRNTIHIEKLITAMNPQISLENSPSYRRFYEAIMRLIL
jgi:hypothetical protein